MTATVRAGTRSCEHPLPSPITALALAHLVLQTCRAHGCAARAGDGTIDVAELMKFVQRGNNNLADELRFTEEVVDALDKDGDGSISR